ncbi:MAG: GNAT family N-acetyltransferase [Gemmataceae bacterium]|nr:GNAT family N-acetyltransferase [Gemmataceae bacterium]MDW8266476.1 GNAT family N-acetyltransferase [Gemmataceae bacterium]
MHVRSYRPGDEDLLRAMTVEAFAGTSIDENIERRFGLIHGHDWRWRKARQFDADLAANPAGLFVAVEVVDGREQLVGYVSTRVDPEAGIGHIPHLVVAAGHRGRGIGKRLIAHALDYFRRQGLTHAQIETLEQNPIGPRLFPACGFVEVARKIYYARALDH